ncbi:DUF6296 family protein [Streptomyces sp. NPDC059740]|uniref:DUF6296 family protein n=1 Tax=Streptomyces sp. NPDC059740 TaxID=3346926 RepID=UPI003666E367
MAHPDHYELVFRSPAVGEEVMTVHRTEAAGASGNPIYEDETGIVRAEISDQGEVRMVASGGHQDVRTPVSARPITTS